MLTMKGPETVILHAGMERATMNSRLVDWLQTPIRRRLCVAAVIATEAVLLMFLIGVDWTAVYLGADGQFQFPDAEIIGLFVAIAVPIFIADQLLFMAIRPVLSFENEPYDERQAGLVMKANGKARYSGMLCLAALTLLGMFQATPVTFFFVGLFLIAMTFMTPHFVLAWTLPDGQIHGDEDRE